jgi:hypothetical protein
MAKLMHVSPWTVRDYLRGRIKASVEFIHAALRATSFHPRVAEIAAPEGGEIRPQPPAPSDLREMEPEVVDLVGDLARLTSGLRQPEAARLTPDRAGVLARLLHAVDLRWSRVRAAVSNRLKRRLRPAEAVER